MKCRLLPGLILLLCCLAAQAQGTNEILSIEREDGQPLVLEFNRKEGFGIYRGRYVLKYGQSVLSADSLEVDDKSGEVVAVGHVTLQSEGGRMWRGERLSYNFKTKVIAGDVFRTGQPPYFITGSHLITDPTNKSYTGTNAYFSTDDNARPNYRIRARKVILIPGQSIEAQHATLYLGDVPVFYFPYYHRSLGRHPNNYEFLIGYRSEWGPYLLNTYNWYWNERIHGALHLDLRGQRGLAGGPSIHIEDPTLGDALFRYYYAHDENPRKVVGYERPPEDRQRFLFEYEKVMRTNLTLRSVVAYQSDPFVIRDFFESEYHDNVQPKSYVELNQQWQNWNLNALTRFRVNDFQETIERLPDIKLTGLRQQVGPTPLYYESESSIGYFRHLFPSETNVFYPVDGAIPNAYSAMRADTYHQVLLPWTFFGWLNVTPRVGDRLTYYSEANGAGTTTDEEARNVFNTGAEVTFKASRLYRSAQSALLEVEGLRHIIQPSANYAFVPEPDDRPRVLPQFDSELPSTKLQPIDFPDYNSIDSIDSRQVVRLGLRNKFQTKRDGKIDNLINWLLFTDWRLERNYETLLDPKTRQFDRVEKQSTFSDVYSELDFKPRTWITLSSDLRYSPDKGLFREANHTLTLMPDDWWSLSLSHRFRRDTPELGVGNNLIIGTFYYRLNENWGVRVSEQFEARDGVLEYQYYTLYRDFRSWTGALTFRIRDNRGGPDDFTVAFTLSLKAFPRYGVGDDAVKPSKLVGG